MTKKPFLAAAAAASLFALTACGSDAGEGGEADGGVGTSTLAALIEDADDLSVVSEIVSNAGLSGVFDGNAPYTVFAPTDEAFSALDVPLEGEETRAARVAILREHIVPGYLSREDIVAAIESAGGSVEMKTMGSNTLTFTRDADNLVVTSSDGSEASVEGEVMSGVNGSVIPIDGVLKSMASPG
ncbi:fasciclin domain-containing protein [Aurantiacibacter hainanensis]|uniref:fasciclin domain-containing protein n=1 Tax=Aurantiacibacter hainanensis TaxID=3076114 RepID=UPI0030C66131